MSLKIITEADLSGKGVCGQADVPGLSAAEMQAKVEEIVRDVVIPAMNTNTEAIESDFATKEELGEAVFSAGAVSSVFGRAGVVLPQAGDYTAAMVGAAAEKHAANHKTGGSDALVPSDIGAAAASHAHGGIAANGAIGSTKGLLVVTGASGVLTTESKNSAGFVFAPNTISRSGAVTLTLADNTEYKLSAVTSLSLIGSKIDCHGIVTFGTAAPTVNLSGFTASSGDDPTSAAAGEVWEFDCFDGLVIWKNWSAA